MYVLSLGLTDNIQTGNKDCLGTKIYQIFGKTILKITLLPHSSVFIVFCIYYGKGYFGFKLETNKYIFPKLRIVLIMFIFLILTTKIYL